MKCLLNFPENRLVMYPLHYIILNYNIYMSLIHHVPTCTHREALGNASAKFY